MLKAILRLLDDGGIHSTAELVRRLGINDGLLAAMTDDLIRRGYLTALDMSCSAACDGCRLVAACSMPVQAGRRPLLLALTAKGQAIARA